MKVQDLWEMYDKGISPFEIENTCKSELTRDKTLAEAMADIWVLPMFNLEDFLIGGKVRSFTSVGGYPIFYWNEEGEILCPCCADKDKEGVNGAYVNWESEMFCDLCSSQIESAY